MMNKIATIILNYNGKHYLEKFLPVILKHNEGYPVYVADNNSADSSVEFLETEYPDSVELIRHKENYGFCKGYNLAIEQIDAEYYVFLNSDVEVTGGWLKPMLTLLESNKKIAVCQPKILDFHSKDHFEYAGASGGYIDLLGYPFCRGRIFKTLEKDFGQYDDVVPVFWASGACMMVRGSVFKEIGGFDIDYFAHMEEIDLCWRIKKSGLHVFCNPYSRVYHVGGGTLPQTNPFKTYLNFRNSLITLIKNERVRDLTWKLPARYLLDIIAGIKFLITDSYKDTLSVLRADLHVLRKFRYYFSKRMDNEYGKHKTSEIYKGILVYSYYVLRKRFYFSLKSIIPDHVVSSAQPFSEIHSESHGQIYNNR